MEDGVRREFQDGDFCEGMVCVRCSSGCRGRWEGVSLEGTGIIFIAFAGF